MFQLAPDGGRLLLPGDRVSGSEGEGCLLGIWGCRARAWGKIDNGGRLSRTGEGDVR